MSLFSWLGFGDRVNEQIEARAFPAPHGERVVYLDKSLINVGELLDGVHEGAARHGWVRRWVHFCVTEPDVFAALCRHDSGVMAEMTALGVNLAIAEQAAPFVQNMLVWSIGVDTFLLLLQRSGFFVLGVFFGDEPSTQITVEDARRRLADVHMVVILNLS